MLRVISTPFGIRMLVSAALLGASPSILADDDDDDRLRAVPFVFVGTAAQCGIAGSNIVTSAWLGGMGLPDNGGPNTTLLNSGNNPNKRDPHLGLLLSKNGPTSDCSSAGAEIRRVRGMRVTPTFELGFDYRNGSHCSGGGPRFNVSYTTPTGDDGFSFVGGCGNDLTPTPAPQDPTEWSRVRFQTSNPAESFPIIPPGSRIERIQLILDEGTDTPTLPRPSGDAGNPAGIGLSVVDNIFINGQLITRSRGIEPEPGERGHRNDD